MAAGTRAGTSSTRSSPPSSPPAAPEILSERTIEFCLEGLNAYRTFARSDDRDLTLALGIGDAWPADFVEPVCCLEPGRETGSDLTVTEC